MICARSRDHRGPAAKHGLYQRKRQPLGARNQDMEMVIGPDLHEVPFKTTQGHAVFQPKVADNILYILCVRPAAEKIEAPIARFPLGSGERLKDAILAFAKHLISSNRRKLHLL